ncbi:MAG: hypothetical protein OJF50_000753 [Nitrospira sp.]|nr:hypothetical protein [Nitrospira sp.]
MDHNLLSLEIYSSGGRVMECPKCHGMLIRERVSDFFFSLYTWNCINCGAMIDRIISHNRRNSLAARSVTAVSKPQASMADAKAIRRKVARLAMSQG